MSNQSSILLITFKKYLVWICIWKLMWTVPVLTPLDNPNPGSFEMEQWKDISNYEGYYRISNLGRVYSIERIILYKNGVRRKHGGIIIKPQLANNGYFRVALYGNGIKETNAYIHRLVAKTFIPNPDNNPQINHENANKLDNRAENLSWVTRIENEHHALINNLKPRGERCGASKLNEFQVRVIRKTEGFSQRALAKIFNVSQRTILLIKHNKTWKN